MIESIFSLILTRSLAAEGIMLAVNIHSCRCESHVIANMTLQVVTARKFFDRVNHALFFWEHSI
jgi:hypothetical protein